MLCRGSSGILIVDLTFHAQWHLLIVRPELPCSDGCACLGSNRCSLAKCATIELVVARWKKCSSKLCWFFGPLEPRSLHQGHFRKKYHIGTATSYDGLNLCKKVRAAKLLGSHQFSQGDAGLCWGRSGYSHCWLDISWPIAFVFECSPQPQCSDSFPCSFASRTGASWKVVVSRCLLFEPCKSSSLQQWWPL